MNTKENRKVQRIISKDAYNPSGAMDLDNNYNMTVAELGLQQSKRDQIIAFYLTILSFVIPSVISLKIPNGTKSFAFIMMYLIGFIFCHVIMRYRVYKEVYWIACKVLTQLCNINKPYINHSTIYTLYFNALVKNEDTIVKRNKKGKLDKDGYVKVSILRSFRRQLDSAETLLFETLVLFSTFVGIIGAAYVYSTHRIITFIIAIYLFCMLIYINYKYTTKLIALYRCVDTELLKDLEVPFKKAWMLHCYVDDITDDEKNIRK